MVRLRGRIGVECKASRAGQVGLRVAETAAKRPGRTADGPGLFDKLFAFTFIIVTSKRGSSATDGCHTFKWPDGQVWLTVRPIWKELKAISIQCWSPGDVPGRLGSRKKQGPAPKRCWKRTRGHRVTLQPNIGKKI